MDMLEIWSTIPTWHNNVNIIGTIGCNYPENEDTYVAPLALWSLERSTILGMQLVPFCVHAGSAYKFPNFIEDFTLTLPCCDSVIQFSKVPKQIYNVGKYGRNPWAKWYCKGSCNFEVQSRVGAIAASAMMPGIQVLYCPGKADCTCGFAWALCVFHQFWLTIPCVSVVSVVTTCYSHWNVFYLKFKNFEIESETKPINFPQSQYNGSGARFTNEVLLTIQIW